MGVRKIGKAKGGGLFGPEALAALTERKYKGDSKLARRKRAILRHFREMWRHERGSRLPEDGSDHAAFSRMMDRRQEVSRRQLRYAVDRFVRDKDPFYREQKRPLRYWASNVDRFLRIGIDPARRAGVPRGRRRRGLAERAKTLLPGSTPGMAEDVLSQARRAESLLGAGAGHAWMDLVTWVRGRHRRIGWELVRELCTGPTTLCEDYLDWLAEQDWMGTRNVASLDPDGGAFARFRDDWSRTEPLGRDPVDGGFRR